MSDVKLLNLDELAATKRAVQLGGETYPVAEQTVGQMIARLQLGKNEDITDPAVFLKNMRKTAQSILPTAPKDVIDALTPKMITKLVEFINDHDLDQAAEEMRKGGAEQAEANPGEPEKKS